MCKCCGGIGKGDVIGGVHLLPTKDQPLLHWRNTLLLFYALLYAGDLDGGTEMSAPFHLPGLGALVSRLGL